MASYTCFGANSWLGVWTDVLVHVYVQPEGNLCFPFYGPKILRLARGPWNRVLHVIPYSSPDHVFVGSTGLWSE